MWLHPVSVEKNVQKYILPKLCLTPEIKSKYFRTGECVGIGQTTELFFVTFCNIGIGRFRILGGQRLEYWGAKGKPNSQQAHDVVTTSMRHNDVTSTSFRHHVPTRFLMNQAQITAFFILKSYFIKISRIELTGIVYQYLQIKLKLDLLLFYPSAWYICDFFLFHMEIEGKCGWIIGRAKQYVAPPPPLKLFFLWGGGPMYQTSYPIF